MRQLVYELRQLCVHNRDGSFTTQYQRRAMLTQMGYQLIALGYRHLHVQDITRRHANKLVQVWKEQGIEHATIANRLAGLRWLCEKVNRASVMPRTNAPFGLTPRQRVATVSKAVALAEDVLRQVDDPYVQMSLRLQAAFGLRREECIKIRVWQADHGAVLALQGSWCKNGREREVPLSWPEQREVLDAAKALVRFKSHSLIPQDLQYFQQRNRYTEWARKLGLPPLHGLRHSYSQKRFAMLAGFACPVCGGPSRETMTPEQRCIDRQVRQQVSLEMGHNRLAIVGMYCGL